MEQIVSGNNNELFSKNITPLEDSSLRSGMNSTILKNKDSKTITKKALELGPLESVFPCSTSKILDFLVTFKDFDYSISDISKNSGVGFKTTLNEIRKLEEEGVIKKTRTVGKAIMYRLNPESTSAKSIQRLAFDIASRRAQEYHN